MGRSVILFCAIVAYVVFFATFLYLIAFVGDLPWVPLTIDRGPESPTLMAAVIDIGLIALFGVQHSVMARPGFKRAWTKVVPPPAERSAYVVAASLALIVLMLFWQPIPRTIWHLDGIAAGAMWAAFAIGWGVVLLTTFLLNHFELFGLQQAWFHLRGRTAAEPKLRRPLFYRHVRHPLYSGFLLAFWAIPTMSAGHLLFAAAMAAYVLIAIVHEERDLVGHFGEGYRQYQREVGKLLPRFGSRAK